MSECWCTPVVTGHVDQVGPAKEVIEARPERVGNSQEGVPPQREEGRNHRRDNTQQKFCSENQVKNVFAEENGRSNSSVINQER